ncbi:helix-turn-helix domain-containing protein [Herbaspirillum sp. SJZ099]|uniref:helix-turn-helix domain-containing protein n=1 Tax=Herbaspirillum sp. SJZ099 TaxID=2572916 RepID=UPI0011AA165E|nr:helix-turn-helix transcriptional regulator [Herbaspirillum sp. SJZ099]TWC71740.1 Xre family transcriptional regulator [Herbaspirillum sp. SJZ099]
MSAPSSPASPASLGDHLRHWRQQRRLSQLELACDAGISARHLSFIETGRSQPSAELLLRLAQQLDIPLRNRNSMLLAAGYAPRYRERPLDDKAMQQTRSAIEAILHAHEPYPALAVDGHWHMLMANRALAPLLQGVDGALLQGQVNVLRLSLHPRGVAPAIINLRQWRAHLLHRLSHQAAQTADPFLSALLEELAAYPDENSFSAAQPAAAHDGGDAIAVPLRLHAPGAPGNQLSLISTTMVFGTPQDITLSELAVETFLPADGGTAQALRDMLAGSAGLSS